MRSRRGLRARYHALRAEHDDAEETIGRLRDERRELLAEVATLRHAYAASEREKEALRAALADFGRRLHARQAADTIPLPIAVDAGVDETQLLVPWRTT